MADLLFYLVFNSYLMSSPKNKKTIKNNFLMKAQTAIGAYGLHFSRTLSGRQRGSRAGGRAVSLDKHRTKLPVWEMRAPLPARPTQRGQS